MATGQTGGQGGGGTPPPATKTEVEKFGEGKILRDGSTAETYLSAEIQGKELGIDKDATQAAVYDEQGLDPYEVSEAKRVEASKKP